MSIDEPFTTAERFLQLQKLCASPSWGDTVLRFNEMIVAPLIAIFCALSGDTDIFMLVSAGATTHRAWSEWLEYQDLRFEVQRMYLTTMASGGPRIVTNDSQYMPYVFADAVVRLRTRSLA